MWLDAVLFAVLLGFGLLGAYRGALESGLRLAAWGLGYAAAWLAATRAGDALGAAFGLPALAGPVLAGTGAFLAVQVAVGVAVAGVRRRRALEEAGGVDRAFGAALGVARGAVLAVLIGWLGLLGDALRAGGAAPALPALDGSAATRWSGVVVEASASALLGDDQPGARAAVALMARPRETLEALRAVLEHPRVASLQRDATFWRAVDAGEVDEALRRPSYRALVADPALRAELAQLGLVSPGAAAHGVAFERELSDAIRVASARIARLREDPEVQALLRDPEVLGLIERRDAVGLLVHPGFQSVVRRATAS